MKPDGIIDDLQQRIIALLRESPAAFEELGIRTEELEDLRSWYREISLARLSMDIERQRYRELLAVVSHGYLITDLEGVIHEADDAAAALMDVPQEFILGRPLMDLVAENGRQDLGECIRYFSQADGGGIRQWQSAIQPPGRMAFPVAFIIFPWRDPEGQTANLYWLLYDLTDRAQMARALQAPETGQRSLIEGLDDMLFVVDSANRFTYVSPTVEQISLYQAPEIIGQHLSRVVHPDDLPAFLSGMERADAHYGETYEFRILRKDGTVAYLRACSRAIIKEEQVLGYVGMAADITIQKEHERKLLAVVSMTAALRTAPDLAAMLPIITEQTFQSLQAQGACLALRDPKNSETIIEHAHGAWSHWVELRFAPSMGLISHVIATGQPYSSPEAQNDPLAPQAALLNGLPALACLPLIAQGQAIGALAVGRKSEFTNSDLRILAIIAEIAANAIQRARLLEQMAQLLGRLESRERFIARIVDSIPSSLLVLDRTLRVISVNHNFEEKTRRSARTTVGHRLEDIFPQVLWDYTHLDQRVREVFRTGQALEGGKVSYRAPNVPTRIYYYRCIPLKMNDATVENVMLLMDDITERERLGEEVRRAEQHLASVVECASDLVISTNAQGVIVTCNRATEITLRRNAEVIQGQLPDAFCIPEQRDEMNQVLQRLRRGELVRNIEINLLTPDKQQVPITWNFSPMLDDSSKVTGIVMVGRDLTERRQLESQLIQSAKMASLGVMAGGIAHELRNPLGIISASAQLLLEFPQDADLAPQCAKKIWAATQRASLIIENLLKFARPQHEQTPDLDLNAALEEILDVLANQMALQKITLHKQLQADLPRICGNVSLLQQVFANLVLNACNAMDQGGTLEIASRKGSAHDVAVSFRDSGHGILPEYLSKIFDPFFTTMPVGQGVGLGLSISYSIIQQHHGVIEVESQAGRGTTFIVRLPISPTDTLSTD